MKNYSLLERCIVPDRSLLAAKRAWQPSLPISEGSAIKILHHVRPCKAHQVHHLMRFRWDETGLVTLFTLAFQSGQWQYSKKAGKLQSSHIWCRSFDINLGEIIWNFNVAWYTSDFAGNKSNIFKHVCSTLYYFVFCEGTKNISISNKTNLTFETGFIMIHPPFPTKFDSGISQLTQSTIEETPPMNQDLGLHLNLKINWIFGRSNHKRSHIEI